MSKGVPEKIPAVELRVRRIRVFREARIETNGQSVQTASDAFLARRVPLPKWRIRKHGRAGLRVARPILSKHPPVLGVHTSYPVPRRLEAEASPRVSVAHHVGQRRVVRRQLLVQSLRHLSERALCATGD